MAKHLKSQIISRLNGVVSNYVHLPANSAPRARGVRYLTFVEGIDAYCGMMNTHKEARHYRKHIIVRRAPEHNGLLQLYTYRFPKHYSEACEANRNILKLAQRMAHDLEHANTREALEWRLRFWHHYFAVFKGGEKPEPGMKRYSRFYQYTYVAILRQLYAAKNQATQTAEEITFEPVEQRPFQADTIRRYQHSLTAHFIPSASRVETPLPAPRYFLTSAP